MKRSSENSVVVAAPVARVWSALSDPTELDKWETTDAHLDLRVSGGFLYEYAYGPSRPGTFLVVDPPHRMVQDNLVFNNNDSFHYLSTLDLGEVEGGTEVTVRLEGYGDGIDEQWLLESMDLGWATDLQVLKAYLERGEDIRPVVWKGLRMGLRYVSSARTDSVATQGIELLEILPGLPAEEAGLRVGDVVVAMDGHAVEDFRGFRRLLGDYKPGNTAVLNVHRADGPTRVSMTFGSAI